MFEAIVAGHVSLDLFPRLPGPIQLEPGKLVSVGPATISTGGAVTNTGLALHRLGVAVRLIGKVGEDLFGDAVVSALAREGLADSMIRAHGESTSYTIVINPPGVDRTFLHCAGANETFSAGDIPYDELPGARIFHFGYPPLMPAIYADGGRQLRAVFERVHRLGLATSLDMCALDPATEAGRIDWEVILARCLPFVDVFGPSIGELLYVLDRDAHADFQRDGFDSIELATLRALADRLVATGTATVMIKLGDRGLYLRTSGDTERMARFCEPLGLATEDWLAQELLAPCFEPRVLAGTTGSGDATSAGFLAALLRGADPAQAAAAATAVGACSVEAVDPTSGIPPWPVIERRMASGWPRSLLTIG